MTSYLMRTPQPHADESPRSYLTRLSETNGYESPQTVIDLLRESGEYKVTSGWDYTQLRSVLGPQVVLPPQFGYRALGKYVREAGQLMGSPVQTRHLGLDKARVCPSCLRALGYVPAAWDLKAYLACPIHGCMMLKYCHACGTRIKHARPGCSMCSCGADLRDAPLIAAPPALAGFCEILHVLATKDHGCLLQAPRLGMPVENLLAMDLDVFARVAVTMANVFQAMAEWRPTARPYTELVEALPDVADTLTSWPTKFEVLCRKWHEHPSKKSRDDGFQMRFSWLFVRLHKNFKSRSRQTSFMLEAACAYATRRWNTRPLMIKNKHIDYLRLPEPRYGSARTAARLLGVDDITAARWAAKGRIPAMRCGKQAGRNWCVDLDAIRRMKFSRHERFSQRDAARFLGLSVNTLRALLASAVIPNEYFVIGRGGAIAREDLETFKQSLLRGCSELRQGIETMPLSEAFSRKSSVYQAEILKGIVSGEVSAYGENIRDICAICVERPRKPIFKQQQEQKPVTHLKQHQVMKKYGLWQNEAKAILRKLGCCELEGGGMESVEIAKIERFLARNILVRRIAAQHGVLSLQLIRALRRRRPNALLSIAPNVGMEVISARLIPRKHLSYARGLARRLAIQLELVRSRPAG